MLVCRVRNKRPSLHNMGLVISTNNSPELINALDLYIATLGGLDLVIREKVQMSGMSKTKRIPLESSVIAKYVSI